MFFSENPLEHDFKYLETALITWVFWFLKARYEYIISSVAY